MKKTHINQLAARVDVLWTYCGSSVDEQETTADELLEALPKQFGRAEAIAEGEKMGLGYRAVETRLKKWVERKMIIRISQGHYCKTTD